MAPNRNGRAQYFWPEQQHTRGNISPVGVTDPDDLACGKLVMSRCCLHEIGQLVRTCFQILQIKYTFGQPTKESRHTVLQHFAARAEQRGIWIKFAA